MNQECARTLINDSSSTSDIQPVCYVLSKTLFNITIVMYQHKFRTHDKRKSILARCPEVHVTLIYITTHKTVRDV